MKLIEALQVVREGRAGLPPAPYFLAAGFTPLHLATFLQAHLRLRRPDVDARVDVGLYGDLVGNVERAAAASPQAALVVVEWSDLDPRLGVRQAGGWLPAAVPDIVASARRSLARLDGALRALVAGAPVALCLPTLPLPPVFHTAGWQAGAAELELRAAVAELARALAEEPRLRVVSAQRLDALSPPAARHAVKAELSTGFPYAHAHAEAVAALLVELVAPRPPKKGLITDLDDTLWAGLLGEVGVDAVAWDFDRGAQLHGLYQQLLAALSASGVLVAVASKNDQALVERAFGRADLLLARGRVHPVHANWGAKSESVRAILRSWNVGADSVVFVDDSPLELAEVQAAFPEVECLRFPKGDPEGVWALLARLRDLFGKPVLLEEDAFRLQSIRDAEAATQRLAEPGADGDDFLAGLDAHLTVDYRRDPTDARAFELVNKTNQFNLNGERRGEADWAARLRRDDAFVATVTYRDKFGPLGKIAVVAGTHAGGEVTVDTWVMSCRAFARRIEHATLRSVFEQFGADVVRLAWRSTERNGPTRELLDALAGPVADEGTVALARGDFEARAPRTFHAVTVHPPHQLPQVQHG